MLRVVPSAETRSSSTPFALDMMVDAVLLLRELCHRQLVGAGLSQDFDYLGIEISPDKPGPKLGYNAIGRGCKTVVGPRFNPRESEFTFDNASYQRHCC